MMFLNCFECCSRFTLTSYGLIVYQKIIQILFAGVLGALLTGCGNGTARSASEVVVVTADKQQVLGYWTPANGANYAFEFLAGATEAPFEKAQRTGRMLQNGALVRYFVWDLQTDGTIVLSLISPSCLSRPLTNCAVSGSAQITASGKTTQDARWNIAFDNDADGVVDQKVSDTYHRAEIDLSAMSGGEFFMTNNNDPVFDSPLHGELKGAAMSIRLEDLDQAVTLTASNATSRQGALSFASDAATAISVTRSFYVAGSGYRDFSVKEWFAQVNLSASANGAYALSYEMHRQVQLPQDVVRAAVQIDAGSIRIALDDFEATGAQTRLVGIVNKFVDAPTVRAQDKFYLSLELDFQKAGAGNELLFTSATEGTVSDTLAHHPEAVSETRNFTWRKQADGALLLSFPAYGDVALRFIRPISGGYQVLYSRPDQGYGPSYRVRDMLRDGAPVLNEKNLAGRYIFTSTAAQANGSHEYSVTFHQNHTVSGAVGGYWFQDTNGDLVGFECSSVLGQDIADYASCAAALEHTSTVNFAHVRRLRFVDQDGVNFQAKYNASVYGTRSFLVYPPSGDPVRTSKFFTAVGAPIQSVALTYRFVRVGDE